MIGFVFSLRLVNVRAFSAAVAFALVVVTMLDAQPARARKPSSRAFVGVPVTRVIASPDAQKKVITTLLIATEVEVQARGGRYAQVRLATGEQGYVALKDLDDTRPTLESRLQQHLEAKENSSPRRRAIEQATALAPGDLNVIDQLQAELEARGDKKWTYYARKGWIAAKRRTFMWDGPLYPVVDGRAAIPQPCDGRATANGKRSPKRIGREELRARAFPLVSSGKVVSVTAKRNITQTLAAPGCDAGSLVYDLPKKTTTRASPDGRGAMVASWLVAGHTVLPFEQDSTRPQRWRAGVYTIEFSTPPAANDSTWTLIETTLDGDIRSAQVVTARPNATPVAIFFDHDTVLRILFWSPAPVSDADACGGSGPSAFVHRFSLAASAPKALTSAADVARHRTHSEAGRVWGSRAANGCPVEQFSPLPGEPRDISHERLESSAWKQ